jgi:uncharacterized protein with HEPN domain
MTERDDRLYLVHIQECIARIELYTAEGKAAFLADTKTQDAVLRNLHTLAESTRRVSEALKASRPDVDWRAIVAFRNIVVHDYLGVDLNQIWDIVRNDLPGLKRAVEAMRQELG